MDLVRLGLERGKTALDALHVITNLLETVGQGGPCSDTMPDFTYHNSFLISDRKEAWVLETAGKLWAAEKIESGFRHISNALSIGTKIDLMSPQLKETARNLGFWKPVKDGEQFHFGRVFAEGSWSDSDRIKGGRRLISKYLNSGDSGAFDLRAMMAILRDEETGICRDYDDGFPSTSSQVSVIRPAAAADPEGPQSNPDVHWFTGTPDPSRSIFKPFVFPSPANDGACTGFQLSSKIMSPLPPTSSPPQNPQQLKSFDRQHILYREHKKAYCGKMRKLIGSMTEEGTRTEVTLRDEMKQLENRLIDKDKAQLNAFSFNEAVEQELQLYQ